MSSPYLQKRAQSLSAFIGSDWLGIYEIDRKEVRRLTYAGPPPLFSRGESYPVGKGNIGTVAALGKKKILALTEDLSPDEVCFKETQSQAIVPLIFQANVLGVLSTESYAQSLFNSSRVGDLEDFACQIACYLHSSNKEFVAGIDFLIEEIMQLKASTYHWTGVYLLNKENHLELAAFRGEATPHMVIGLDSGICGAAVREKKTLNIADVSKDARYLSCSIKTKSEIVVPIYKRDQVIGEIDIDSHFHNAFDDKDEEFLSHYAGRISSLLD